LRYFCCAKIFFGEISLSIISQSKKHPAGRNLSEWGCSVSQRGVLLLKYGLQ